jgi:tungstate transport system permease protein
MFETIIDAFQRALQLIFSGDPELFATALRTVYVAGLGTLLACLWGIPIAVLLGLYSFRGRWLIKSLFNALLGVPTVALGLLLVMFLSKSGPAGFLHLLYTLNGIAVGQALLVTPIIVSYTSSALAATDIQLRDLAKTLGASNIQTNLAIMREAMWATVLALISAFNRGFGELGIALMVGGNILYVTRVLTTSIALEATKGEYAYGIALAIILMAMVVSITILVNLVERLEAGGEIKRIRERLSLIVERLRK